VGDRSGGCLHLRLSTRLGVFVGMCRIHDCNIVHATLETIVVSHHASEMLQWVLELLLQLVAPTGNYRGDDEETAFAVEKADIFVL
jgi:hypothetical protein